MLSLSYMNDNLFEKIPPSYFSFIYHYYRAEIYRETAWRNRMDTTTNWAIITTAAILSFAFTNKEVPHTVILINFFIVWFFLYVESRRFRDYALLRERTRILEKKLLTRVLSGQKMSSQDLEKMDHDLISSLKKPQIIMPRLTSIAWRLRRNYIMIFPIIFISWLAKIQNYPRPAVNMIGLFNNAQFLFIPGWLMFWSFLFLIVLTIGLSLCIPNMSDEDDLP